MVSYPWIAKSWILCCVDLLRLHLLVLQKCILCPEFVRCFAWHFVHAENGCNVCSQTLRNRHLASHQYIGNIAQRNKVSNWNVNYQGQLDVRFLPNFRIPVRQKGIVHMNKVGAPCGFSGRFEDHSFSMKTKMKICSNIHWRMKMWRTQISGLLKNEDYQLPHSLKMNIAFLKLLKTEDLKTPLENVKKMKTMSCAGSPKVV